MKCSPACRYCHPPKPQGPIASWFDNLFAQVLVGLFVLAWACGTWLAFTSLVQMWF